jgi:hypothetical protein
VALGSTVVASLLAVSGPVWEILTASPNVILDAATSNPDLVKFVWSVEWLRKSILTNLVVRGILGAHAWRRLLLATLGSLAQVKRAWQVYKTNGEQKNVVDRAVEEGKLTSLLLLASFV